jgi:hypothetical protein
VNGGTDGSEPQMGFGGVEALAVRSDWKYVTVVSDPTRV